MNDAGERKSIRIALFPGSFDPLTRGHLDVVRRAAPLFDRLLVAVIDNPSKSPLFTARERVRLLERELKDMRGVDVTSFTGLTAAFAVQSGARWILRGIRSAADVAYELPMALSNRVNAAAEVETIFIATSPEHSFVASRLVREIAASGGRLEAFVTPAVEAALREKFSA